MSEILSNPVSPREQILMAARERFLHYGYPKTTIADIAHGCTMSPGNIYRFFKGKIDIAMEIAQIESRELTRQLEALLRCPVRSARQQLEEILFTDLRHSFHLFENQPKVIELAQIVMRERPHFHDESMRRERRTIVRVLQKGVASGEFHIDNIAKVALAIQTSTQKFHYAQLMTYQNLAELERELACVMTVLMRGILSDEELRKFTETTIPPHRNI